MKVSVVGIGRVGLPLAMFFASKGIHTYGVDIDEKKVQTLKAGKMPFLEEGSEELLRKTIGDTFEPTTDFTKVKEADYVILTLGTPVDEFLNPDFSQLENALGSLMPNLRGGHTLILRSTVSPGSTEYVKNYIEKNTNFRIGKDIYLAFCPERIAEGKALKELEELPEIIGYLDEKSRDAAADLFKAIDKEVYTSSAINVELLKLFTNMYRYINFSVGNEFLVIAEDWGANIHEIVELSNKNYPRGGPKIPGFAAGPCLFKDGFFLTSNIPFPDLISAAWRINENLPGYLIHKAKKIKSIKGAKCVVLGLSFKANIDDDRASLSHKIRKIMEREMGNVITHDVYLDDKNFEETLKDADFLVIATAHNEYKKPLDYYKKFVKPDCVVIDIWNLFGKNSVIFRC
jgi:UDP-N-acetyl-D-mannosaminuronic acid dehydrogenase